MKVKTKVILFFPIIFWRKHRANVLAKKIRKWKDESRYPTQWRIKYVIKHIKKFFKIMKIRVDVKGYENIPKGTVLLAPNHVSLFDPGILVLALINNSPIPTDHQFEPLFLAKKELKKNFFKGYFNILSTFYVNRSNPREALKDLDEFMNFAKKHHKVGIIFPEGTRSKTGEIQKFKGGAFWIAKKGFIPIIPVTINNSLSASNLNRRNWLNVEVIFGKPLKPINFLGQDTKAIAERVEKIVSSSLKKSDGKRSK